MDTLGFFQQGLLLVIMLAAPPLLATVITGVLTSMVQSLLQIQDQSMPFVLKLLALSTALYLTGRWMGRELLEFATLILETVPGI